MKNFILLVLFSLYINFVLPMSVPELFFHNSSEFLEDMCNYPPETVYNSLKNHYFSLYSATLNFTPIQKELSNLLQRINQKKEHDTREIKKLTHLKTQKNRALRSSLSFFALTGAISGLYMAVNSLIYNNYQSESYYLPSSIFGGSMVGIYYCDNFSEQIKNIESQLKYLKQKQEFNYNLTQKLQDLLKEKIFFEHYLSNA